MILLQRKERQHERSPLAASLSRFRVAVHTPPRRDLILNFFGVAGGASHAAWRMGLGIAWDLGDGRGEWDTVYGITKQLKVLTQRDRE